MSPGGPGERFPTRPGTPGHNGVYSQLQKLIAAGWSDTFSLKQSYQQADDATMLQVVLGGGELRERQA